MTKTRLTFASLLVIVGVLAVSAAPALAKTEHVYSAVFGKEVNKTTSAVRNAELKKNEEEKEKGEPEQPLTVTEAEEDSCTVASGDECQPGKIGTGSGQFGSNPNPSEAGGPGAVAVNEATGDVYVIDNYWKEYGGGRVEEFNSTGTAVLAEFGLPGGSLANGIAIDNCENLGKPCSPIEDPSVGDVYVATVSGSSAGDGVFKFTAGGTELPKIEFNGGGSAEGVAVDPEGKVWVSGSAPDVLDGPVDVYGDEEPNTLLSELHTPFAIEAQSTGLAVDSQDNLYALNEAGVFGKVNSSAELLISEVDGETSTAAAVNLDPSSGEFDDVYLDNVGSIAEFGPAPGCTAAKPCQTDPEPLERFGSGHLAESDGVGVNSANGTAYVANHTGDDVDVFVKASIPAVTTSEPTELEHEGTATLNGTVNPEGVEVTTCEFEYGPTSAYGTVKSCPAGIVGSTATEELPVSADLAGLTPDTLYHYRLVAGYTGANNVDYGPDQTFVAGALPTISVGGEPVSAVDSSEATLSAEINPGGLATTYSVQYGPCPEPYQQSVCEAAPYPSSTPELSAGAGFTATPVQVHLHGLRAGISYHARLVASNAILGSPVFGGELVFTTVSSTGASGSGLPDQRAYELVSPVTGQDTDVFVPFGMEEGLSSSTGEHGIITTRVSQAAAGGDAVVYQGDPPPAGGTGEFNLDKGDDYLATRAAGGGWTAVDVEPPGVEGEYEAFSSDLSAGIFLDYGKVGSPLASDAPLGYANLYAHMLGEGPGGAFDPVLTANPPNRTPLEFDSGFLAKPVGLSGANAGEGAVPALSHVLFAANAALTPEAVDGSGLDQSNLYDAVAGKLYLVNVLPDGKTEPGAQFGIEEPESNGDFSPNTSNVISANGSRIYWTAVEIKVNGGQFESIPKALYVRVNDTEPQSPIEEGECVDPADACTLQVDAKQGGPGPSGDGRYWTASANGEEVFFTDEHKLTAGSTARTGEPDLYEYDLGAPEEERLTDLSVVEHSGEHADVQGVVGVSEDGSYLYFVADSVLASNKNSEGAEPVPGEDNLYLRHDGATTFIATLSGVDDSFGPSQNAGGDWNADPGHRTAAVTPDGHTLTFMSRAPLTGYDSHTSFYSEKEKKLEEQNLAEVFVYDVDTNRLTCASCDPGVAPVVPPPIRTIAETTGSRGAYLYGSFLPTGANAAGHEPRVISADGDRIFFNSFEPLVPDATNGWLNVYEWEREGTESTPGSGFSSCPVTTPARSSGGCTFLISGASSDENSYLLDADATGENVFFVSRGDLLPADRGDDDVLYDARVDGYQPPAPAACSGTGCQGVPPAPPIFATPSSVTFNGIGNFPPPTPTVVKPKVETKAEKLTKALKVCHKDKKKTKRVACEKQAQKHYGVAKKSAKRATNDRRGK
jgi:hypothetical protein